MTHQLQSAKDLLKRAVELDAAQRYSEARICYEEGIQSLLHCMKEIQSDAERKDLRTKIEGYLKRAETLKQLVKAGEEPSEKVHCIQIKAGDKGHGYETLFKDCLDGNVEWVELDDPYIRARHQIRNFVHFCELLVKCCKKLKRITLTTGTEISTADTQASSLQELGLSLKEYGILLTIVYSDTLHDREIRFSNGWIVKIGRGLDYFQRPAGQFTIGCYDYNFRPCHETTVEIYHKLNKTVKRL